MVSIVVAYARNRVIGRDGDLPWHLPSDLRRFKELTNGHAVVMGRRTFESLPPAVRPLPGRRNLVLSTHADYEPEGAEVFGQLNRALDATDRECFVIGGEQTYRHALSLATRVLATEVEADVEGDTYFPCLATDEWRLAEQSSPLSENGHSFRFQTYERRG
jgi:dihydrofolate reductase